LKFHVCELGKTISSIKTNVTQEIFNLEKKGLFLGNFKGKKKIRYFMDVKDEKEMLS